MSYLISDEMGCKSCRYADLYIPFYTYPHSDPYCAKGHGLCEEDKICEDYELIGRLSR